MTFIPDVYYFNGEKVSKHVLNKYLEWGRIISLINKGCNQAPAIKERLGYTNMYRLTDIKNKGYIKGAISKVAVYTVTEKGLEFLDKVNKHIKENKECLD